MPGMPFYVEKGPQFQFIEEFVMNPVIQGHDLLRALRSNSSSAANWVSVIADKVGLRVGPQGGGPGPDLRVEHLNSHWFEQRRNANQQWQRDAAPAYPAVNADGSWWWWQGYAGDVYEIMRWTMIRAGEVSLGIGPTQDPLEGRAEPWPIELFWHCSQNWFEGWVTWRRNGSTGQVTVVLCTPTAGTPVRPSPLASQIADPNELGRATGSPYAVNPATPGGDRGMVVVTHTQHVPVAGGPTQLRWPTLKGELPGPARDYWRGTGPVVAVSPSWADGGVDP